MATRDAWKQQNGLSRTEAKRRYITTLIDTMHKFASPSPDSRELVAELEFVWDQVKSNVPSSSSSSPLRTLDHVQPGYSEHELGQSGRAAMGMKNTLEHNRSKRNTAPRYEQAGGEEEASPAPMRAKSPMSQSEEALEEEEANIDREIFVDAPDSQYNPTSYPDDEPSLDDAAVQTDLQQLMRAEPIPIQTPTPAPRNRGMVVLGKPIQMPIPGFGGITPAAAGAAAPGKDAPKDAAADQKWKKRVEQSLMKMTAEVAALREQLEARRLFAHSAHYRLFRGIWRWLSACVRHVAVDVFILGIVLLWMRRKKDRRLEAALSMILGEAVGKMRRVRIPLIGGRRKT
ncbi:acyl binding [Pyrenophora seminiperda CCB06]|uniref:Acyl binding n=1 Tax=Pyrenophora seminiperda CCB06 TaxID=1302712 RepID=A0A3M7LYP4_9PLEO|nr:acyl binding [Pyrenophora seminiperda CCB06]